MHDVEPVGLQPFEAEFDLARAASAVRAEILVARTTSFAAGGHDATDACFALPLP